jgi:hypothetical protein
MSTPHAPGSEPAPRAEEHIGRGRLEDDETQAPGAPLEGLDAPCLHKRQFLDAYRAATAVFSSRLTLLNDRMGTSSRDEYERLRQQVDEARVGSEQARLALERHVADHGC